MTNCDVTAQTCLNYLKCMKSVVLLIITALRKAGVFASNRNIYYEMIENRTIAASSK